MLQSTLGDRGGTEFPASALTQAKSLAIETIVFKQKQLGPTAKTLSSSHMAVQLMNSTPFRQVGERFY